MAERQLESIDRQRGTMAPTLLARKARDGQGFMLIEALLLILLISIAVAAFVILVPTELRLQRMALDRGTMTDRADWASSWADKFLGAARRPLNSAAADSIDYSVLSHTNEPENLCYHIQLNRDTHQVTVKWGTMVGNPLHCPSAYNLPTAGPLVLAQDVINQSNEPLFTYYASSDESEPVDPNTTAAKNANSLTLTLRMDSPSDFAPVIVNHFRVLFGGAIVTRSIANNAVTADKIADGSITPAKIANNSIGAGALPPGAITTFDDIPVVSNSTRDFAPGDASGVGQWHDNALSPAAIQGGVSFTAGDANAASMTVDWGGLCRRGFELEARGLYTVYNPPGNGPVNIGIRLVGYTGLGRGEGFVSFLAAPTSVLADQYIRQASDWQQIDLGHCSTRNFLIKHSPFLYRIQTKSNQLQPYGVVNAIIELRYTPEVPPTGNPAPLAAEALSPLSDSDIKVSSPVTLTGRFMDANPDENDGLLEFQLCDAANCATPLDSGQTQGGIGNGGFGSWLSSYRLVANHDYYWRVRGVDHSGQNGPWSAAVIIHAIA